MKYRERNRLKTRSNKTVRNSSVENQTVQDVKRRI